ncbi:MAG: type II secretion system minor pseudopilin GspK [Congregibacter sp.]
MSCRRPHSPNSQRGMALVVALLVFAICASLMVALQSDFDISYRRAANSFVTEQSWEYLLGAEDLARLVLQLDHDADLARDGPSRDDLSEIWAQARDPYPLDDGAWMSGELEDLQGRFNLNNLAEQPGDGEGVSRYSLQQRAFIRLLQALETVQIDQIEAITIMESIADWVDPDDEPRLNGAESSYYVSLTPSYRPSNRAMLSISELRAVANVRSDVYRALRPLVTVWPQAGSLINLHTARVPVLRALNGDDSLQPLSLDDGLALERQRLELGFADKQDFLDSPVLANASPEAIAGLITESSSFFLLRSLVEFADRQQRLYSVMQRQDRQINVLQRSNVGLIDSLMDATYNRPTDGPGPLTETLR